MKINKNRFVGAIFGILLISVFAIAQKTEKFDVISYSPPSGWQKEVSKDAVQLGIEDSNGGTCLITMLKSVPASDDSKVNFESAWESIVKETVKVSGKPQMQPSTSENGWTAESGFAKYESDGRSGLVMLIAITGDRRMINILALTNTNSYREAISEFLGSINLPEIKTSAQRPAVQIEVPNSLTQNVWKNTQNRKDNLGSFGGYSSNTYQIFANGTYKFSNVTFQSFAPKFAIVDEEGTFQVSGNTITLNPRKSVYHVHQKEKTDPPSKSGNLALEKTQYRFEFTTIYDRQRLILAPVNENETKRDGAFNFYNNGAMTKSYLYDAQ